MPVWTGGLPLSKKDHERCEPRQPFRGRPYDAASAPQDETSKANLRSERRLRATRRSDHRLRRWPLDESAGLRGPSNPERRTIFHAACCRRTTRAKVPLLMRATRASLGVAGSSYCGLDIPAVLTNRPRPLFQRRPAKSNAFLRAGMPSTPRNLGGRRSLFASTSTGTFHYAAARLSSV